MSLTRARGQRLAARNDGGDWRSRPRQARSAGNSDNAPAAPIAGAWIASVVIIEERKAAAPASSSTFSKIGRAGKES